MEVEGTVTEKPCGCGRLRCLRLARHKHLVWICLGTNRNCPWVLSSAGICKVLWSHICVRGTCVWVWEQENAMLRRCLPLHSAELRSPPSDYAPWHSLGTWGIGNELLQGH